MYPKKVFDVPQEICAALTALLMYINVFCLSPDVHQVPTQVHHCDTLEVHQVCMMYSQMLHKMPDGYIKCGVPVFVCAAATAAASFGNSQRKGVRQAVQRMMAGTVPWIIGCTPKIGGKGIVKGYSCLKLKYILVCIKCLVYTT